MGKEKVEKDKTASSRSAQIDNDLEKDWKTQSREIKLLTLGAGDSGKSTFVKQLKILHDKGFNEDDRKVFKGVIYDNIIESTATLVKSLPKLDLELPENLKEYGDVITKYRGEDVHETIFCAKIYPAVKALLLDPSIQKCYDRSSELQMSDSTKYFYDNLDRISQPNFIPTVEDVLRFRVPTTGVHETRISINNNPFRVIDVGGQRSERRKWIHCFEDVTAVVFFVSASGYDQVLFEDYNKNRLIESLELFGEVVNNKYFEKTAYILFLNKRDLFEQKIIRTPLSVCFQDYKGAPGEPLPALNYIREKFFEQDKRKDRKLLYCHFTCATDTNNMKHVVEDTAKIIIEVNLRKAGLA
eukprot:Opistho-2@30304